MALLMYPDYGYAHHSAIHSVSRDPLHELYKNIATKTQLPAKLALRRLGIQTYALIDYLLERDNGAANHETVPALTKVVDDALG